MKNNNISKTEEIVDELVYGDSIKTENVSIDNFRIDIEKFCKEKGFSCKFIDINSKDFFILIGENTIVQANGDIYNNDVNDKGITYGSYELVECSKKEISEDINKEISNYKLKLEELKTIKKLLKL